MNIRTKLVHLFAEERDPLLVRLLMRICEKNGWDYSACVLGQDSLGDQRLSRSLYVVDFLAHPHQIDQHRGHLNASARNWHPVALVAMPLSALVAMAKAPLSGVDYCFLSFDNLDEMYLRLSLMATRVHLAPVYVDPVPHDWTL